MNTTSNNATERAMHKIRVSRSRLILQRPFFGAIALRMDLRPVSPKFTDTMATDGRNLYFYPPFVESINEDELEGVIAHEVQHCTLKHHLRMRDRNPKGWNIATDYAINIMLTDEGFKLPEGGLLDPKYRGMSADAIYELLKQEQEQQQGEQGSDSDDSDEDNNDSNGSDSADSGDEGDKSEDNSNDNSKGKGDDNEDDEGGDGGDASSDEGNESGGAGDANSDSENGGDSDNGNSASNSAASSGTENGNEQGNDGTGTSSATANDVDANAPPNQRWGEIIEPMNNEGEQMSDIEIAQESREWDIIVNQAAQLQRRRGDLPGWLQELVESINHPVLSWREVLRRFFDKMSNDDFNWNVPNRRFVAGGSYLPSMLDDGSIEHIALVIDTSGSVSSANLRMFLDELNGILDEVMPDRVTVIPCDMRVIEDKIVEYGSEDFPVQSITVGGRGGTSMNPAFKWIEDNLFDVSAIICMTDMEIGDLPPQPDCPVLWVDCERESRYKSDIAYGDYVNLTE